MNNILYMHPLDQCSTFIMHSPRANLRPLYYTKCPPNRIEKWSQICCISKHNKVGFALLSTREANFFMLHVRAILRPLLLFGPPHGGMQKWSRNRSKWKHSWAKWLLSAKGWFYYKKVFMLQVRAILRPLLFLGPPHGGWQKWSRILD